MVTSTMPAARRSWRASSACRSRGRRKKTASGSRACRSRARCSASPTSSPPGHTPGHVVFVHEGARLAIVGDVLFAGSIGRTDFPRGDHQTLIRSIREKLFPLGDDITFIPGHGPTSTFGEERDSNPFVGAY